MNKKIIEGLSSIAEGINLIVEGLSKETSVSVNEVAELCPEPVVVSAKTVSAKSEKVTKPVAVSSSEYTEEELGNMSYNDIKKLAKELGISATGNRKELVKKILSADDTTDSEEIEDTEVTPEPVKETKSSKKSAPKSFKKKVEEPEPEPEIDEPDDSEEEEELDPTEAKVKEATEDMSDEELRELLEDVGVSPKGKRQSLISKLVKAVEDGLIDIDGEDEEAETPESDEVEESDVTEGMTKARRESYEGLCDDTSEAFESGEITRADLIEFINAFNGTDDKFKKVSDEELLTKYLELSAMLVDDEGNVVEEGAYTINDEPYCCGHPLHYDEDSEKFICECCGSEYEAE